MNDEVKIVARMKNGEVLKGYAKRPDVENMNASQPAYLRLADPGNTVGVYLCQDQLEGLFIVKTFSGNKPGFFRRCYYDIGKFLKNQGPMLSAAFLIAVVVLTGLVALL